MNRRATGKLGEDLAVDYLRGKGYQILERGWRVRAGEVDIIAKDNEGLVFVEVKTRHGRQFGLPEQAVDERKIARVQAAAICYLEEHHALGREAQHRFDVVAIEISTDQLAEIHHIEGVSF